VDIKYASRYLWLPAGALGEERLILIGTETNRPTAMALFAQEDNRWILTLAITHRPTQTGSWPSRRPWPPHT
jgi:hypothetical protein